MIKQFISTLFITLLTTQLFSAPNNKSLVDPTYDEESDKEEFRTPEKPHLLTPKSRAKLFVDLDKQQSPKKRARRALFATFNGLCENKDSASKQEQAKYTFAQDKENKDFIKKLAVKAEISPISLIALDHITHGDKNGGGHYTPNKRDGYENKQGVRLQQKGRGNKTIYPVEMNANNIAILIREIIEQKKHTIESKINNPSSTCKFRFLGKHSSGIIIEWMILNKDIVEEVRTAYPILHYIQTNENNEPTPDQELPANLNVSDIKTAITSILSENQYNLKNTSYLKYERGLHDPKKIVIDISSKLPVGSPNCSVYAEVTI